MRESVLSTRQCVLVSVETKKQSATALYSCVTVHWPLDISIGDYVKIDRLFRSEAKCRAAMIEHEVEIRFRPTIHS